MEMQVPLPKMEAANRSYRAQVVESLARFRQEWQSAVENQSLVDVKSSVGLLFSDIAERLELNPQERFVLLGKDLAEEIETSINQPLGLEIVEEKS